MNYVDESNVQKNSVLNLRNNSNIYVLSVNVELKIKIWIDTNTPLSIGGINEKSNPQGLCKAYHLIQTSNEHESGQYIFKLERLKVHLIHTYKMFRQSTEPNSRFYWSLLKDRF